MDWLRRQNQTVYAKAVDLAKRLRDEGEDLDMPYAKILQDGIYELRIKVQNVPYRILYTFVGKRAALLTNGVRKEAEVPPAEIERALNFKAKYLNNPELHTHRIYK